VGAGPVRANVEALRKELSLESTLGNSGRQHVLDNFTDTQMAERTIAFYRFLYRLIKVGGAVPLELSQ